MIEADIAVIGAGIAGVSAAYELTGTGSVVLLEQERVAAYHTTGRSAAMFLESYGSPAIRSLTSASRADFDAAGNLLTRRPLIWVAPAGDLSELTALHRANPRLEALDETAARRWCPVLRPGWCAGALLESGALEIDVLGLHQLYLGRARRRGLRVELAAPVTAARRVAGCWELSTGQGPVRVQTVVNAAGAWADRVAGLLGLPPVGLRPLVRTAAVARAGALPPDLPLVSDVAEQFYFRPEGTGILVSPADETPAEPGDVRPQDTAVALALERVNAATTLGLRSVLTAWAGLRTFAPDRDPVVGPDPLDPSVFWLAGQGGYGIQSAPALARALAAAVTVGTPVPPAVAVARFRVPAA